MSNGIYEILGKLNGLKPKDNPVSMSAEPVYESIDPQDITPAVDSLEEKYQNFLIEETAKRSQQKDAEISRGEPEIVKLLNKARLERPSAASDTEALAYQMVKANKELEKEKAANDEQETKIADLQAKVSASPTAKPAPVAQPMPTPAPVAQPTAAAPTTAPAARPSATILRMPTPATAEVPTQAEVPAQAPATAEVPAEVPVTVVKGKSAKSANVDSQVPLIRQGTDLGRGQQPTKVVPTEFPNVTDIETMRAAKADDAAKKAPGKKTDKAATDKAASGKFMKNIKNLTPLEKEELPDVVNFDTIKVANSATNPEESVNKGKNMLRENIEMLKEYREGDPALGIYNYNDMLVKFKTGVQQIRLDFGAGKTLALYDYQIYGLLAYFGSDQNEERKISTIENVMSSYDTVVNALMLPKVKQYISLFPEFEKKSPIFKQRARDIEKNKFKLEPTGEKGAGAAMGVGSQKDPGGFTPVQPHPYQQGDNQLEENSGNDNMQENVKTSSILKAVHQVEDKKLRESAKPDFLDLDKDGDTDEPMKSAAKSSKDHEPAEVDSDAVAKRKRLQALKDKQEDERAEKGDDYKSSTRVVKGRAYGGSAQKDDEDKDELEEGKFKEIYTDMMDYATKKGYSSHKQFTPADYDELAKPHGISGKELAVALGHKKVSQVEEVAPPGAKAERMVKHIKKGYSKDGNLSKREKGIAYATAWKAHNKGQVEEGTNFGDTIKNSEGKMTKVKVTEGKDAIRNHPIYTTKEAWDHYSQELAEQEMMDQSMMEAPVVDVQQELDEIAKLAGLAPKMEAKSVCPSCKCEKCECNENLDPMVPSDSASPLTHTLEGMGCTMEELEEAASRKDFRRVADRIANMKDRDEAAKLGHAFADDFEQANPRFKRKMFLTACGLDEAACNMRPGPATIMVGEEAMDEGNEFTKARLDAIAQGKDTFSVSGKTYNVSGDTSDEKTQVESVNEDINVNITANGEQDALNLLRKLSGMAEVPQVTGIAIPMGDESATCGACGSSPCGCEESVEEERDIELANTPHETVAPINAVTTDAGGGLGGVKKQYPLAANRGANPLEEEKLWTAYENMINDVKA